MANKNYSLQCTAKAEYNGKEITLDFDPYSDHTDMDSVRDACIDKLKSEYPELEDEDDFDEDQIVTFIDEYDSDIPESYQSEKDVWEFAEAFAECNQKVEVVEAALYLGVSNIDDAYAGEFSDDEEFAQDYAEGVGAIDRDAKWPMNHIDWEAAASDLMQDYSEHKGYYFRRY